MHGGRVGGDWYRWTMGGICWWKCIWREQGGWVTWAHSWCLLVFGGGCWSVLVVGSDTDLNFLSLFLLKICNYAVVTSSCLVWFLIFFGSWILCAMLAQWQKGAWKLFRPESTMMVLQEDFWRVVTVAAAKTVPEYYYYCFLMPPCPIWGERAVFGYGWEVVDIVSVI